MRYPPGIVRSIIDADRGYASTEMVGGVEIPVKYGTFTPPVDRQYPVFTTRDGRRWIKAYAPAVAGLHALFVRKEQNWPAWDNAELYSRQWSLNVQTSSGASDDYRFVISGGVFTTITRHGANINGTVFRPYHGPSATQIASVHASARRGLYYIGDKAGGVHRNEGFHLTDANPLAPPEDYPIPFLYEASRDFVLRGNCGFEIYALACHITEEDHLWAMGVGGQVAESLDGGTNWSARATIPLMGVEALAFASPEGSTLLASSTDDATYVEGGGFTDLGFELARKRQHISLNGGVTWATQIDLIGTHDPATAPAAGSPISDVLSMRSGGGTLTFHVAYNATLHTRTWQLVYDAWHTTDGVDPAFTTDGHTAVLAADIADVDVALSLTGVFTGTGTGFENGSAILVDSEEILLGGKSGNSFSAVTRGHNGTTPAAHAAGTIVGLSSVNISKWWYMRYELGSASGASRFYDAILYPQFAVRDGWHFT